jgi:hypothetical protein
MRIGVLPCTFRARGGSDRPRIGDSVESRAARRSRSERHRDYTRVCINPRDRMSAGRGYLAASARFRSHCERAAAHAGIYDNDN